MKKTTILLSALLAALLGVAEPMDVPFRGGGGLAAGAVRVPGVSEWAMGVCLDGTTLYVVAGGVLSAFDVREPLKPKLLGQLPGMDNNRQVVAQDGFVYVVSRETGMRIIDARDPKNMRLRSRYDSVEFATGIDVVGKTAFLSERIYGVEVVDVSDPDNPAHVCIRKTGESQSNRYRDGYLYSGEWGGGAVEVFDARDLKTFRPIGHLRLGGFGDGLEIDGDGLYCSTGHDAKHHRAKAVKDRLGANRFLYTIQQPQSSVYDYGTAAFYVFVEADGTYSRPLALPPVPAFGKGRSARFSGIPRADGSLVLMTNRSERKAVV